MGIKERREREKKELRAAILMAAREIAGAEGWVNVSIRKIADKIEYSAPIIYEHFDDKDALLLALLVEGFRLQHAQMHAARAAAPDPESALLGMAFAYLDFARANPDLYQVMYGLDGVRFGDMTKIDKPQEILEVVNEVTEAIQAWAVAYKVPLGDGKEAFELFWATLHGLVSLEMAGRIYGGMERTRHLVEKAALQAFLAWRHGA